MVEAAGPIKSRIEKAAVELFKKRAVSKVTAASIARRAGVTERTFFRYFSNKLDAFFGEESAHVQTVVSNVSKGCRTSLEAALLALRSLATKFSCYRVDIVARSTIVAANVELQEREAARGIAWAAAIVEALRSAGYDEHVELAASLALTIFRRAYEVWLVDSTGRLEDILDLMSTEAAKQMLATRPHRKRVILGMSVTDRRPKQCDSH